MSTLWLRIVDADFRAIADAAVRAVSARQSPIDLRRDGERWVGRGAPDEPVTIDASAPGFEPETHTVALRDDVTQVVIGLRRAQAGQLSYTCGNNRLAFAPVKDAFVIRVRGAGAADVFAELARDRRLKWQPVLPESGSPDDLFVRVSGEIETTGFAELSRRQLDVVVARIIEHGNGPARGLTNEIVVCFEDEIERSEAEEVATAAGMAIIRPVLHAGNAFLLSRSTVPCYDVLTTADVLSTDTRVRYVEPNLLFPAQVDQYVPNDPLWPQVPHLPLIGADKAWGTLGNLRADLRGGSPDITIAIIDPHGVTPNHPDLTAKLTDGLSKLVTSMNFAAVPISEQSVDGLAGNHGTQCAAAATAAFDDLRGLPGVAPNCRLIGVRIGSAADPVSMADVYMWAGGFLNGSTAAGFPAVPLEAADVISSSWGWGGAPLSNTIRDCFDFLTTHGRNGKGCVLCFSIGNDGYIDFTDPADVISYRAWPTYDRTLAIGSSINAHPTSPVAHSMHADPCGKKSNIATSVDTRALYSPYGAAELRKPDLVCPSATTMTAGKYVDPVLSAVRTGIGCVDGCIPPAVCRDYARNFGGTSFSTPTVAGAVALIMSLRPELRWSEVREILRRTCARIDAEQTNPVGEWQDLDGDSRIDYSRWYGAGRLDVAAAVSLALDFENT
jgi:hypothetical protein